MFVDYQVTNHQNKIDIDAELEILSGNFKFKLHVLSENEMDDVAKIDLNSSRNLLGALSELLADVFDYAIRAKL